MKDANPCDICKSKDNCSDECILNRIYNKAFYCKAYDCFVNYEGSCLLSLYDDCECRKSFEE